jgi:signal transduction histidine kinase
MRISTRVTLLTTMLVAPVLGVLGYAALRARRADLEADLARQAREVADALRAGIEPLSAETAVATLTDRAWRSRERDDAFQLEILKAPGGGSRSDRRPSQSWQTSDPGWLVLLQAAEIQDGPVGRFFEPVGGLPAFAMAVPLYDERALSLPKDHPRRSPVAVLGMRRSTGYIDLAVGASARRIFPLLLGVVVLLAVAMLLALRAAVTAPLRRLLEGIDAVGKGDLSRVLLAEREDDIGTLAARFNAMTASLREAREEGSRGAEARLALETRLRQAEKLATIGQLAAEIAHELGTPLNVIGGRARALAKKAIAAATTAVTTAAAAAAAREVGKNAEIISEQVARITKIINQVLDFSRKRGPTLTRVDLAAVVGEAMDFVRESIQRQGIVVDLRVPSPPSPAPPDVPGDPDQIQQVCLNLLINAIHAMPTGGRLTVLLEQVTRRKGGLDLAAPAEYAMLQVGDTGAGVADADRDNIFEAFFTTKGEGQGTGLGLAVSHGIVKDHDGWIEVESPPAGEARGTVFRVYLPLGAAAAAATERSEQSGLR